MTTKNTGKSFELLVEEIFSYMYASYPNASIKHNEFLESQEGLRQFDVVITIEIPDSELITVIEAKDYKSRLSISKIDEFHSKMRDVHASKGIIISKMGFSSKAISKAKRLGIDLYALNDHKYFKEFDVQVPILIQQIQPYDVDINYNIAREELIKLPEKFYMQNDYVVNGVPLFDLINKSWATGDIVYDVVEGFQEIKIKNFEPPYNMAVFLDEASSNKILVSLNFLSIKLRLRFRFFLVDIRSLLKNEALKNILKNEIRFFVNSESIKEVIDNLTPVQPNFAQDFTGHQFIINVTTPSDLRPLTMRFQNQTIRVHS